MKKLKTLTIYLKNKWLKNIIMSPEKTIVTDLFNSVLITICKCIYGKEIYSLHVIIDYPLLISAKKISVDVQELLKNYFGKEKIEFIYECSNCKKKDLNNKKLVKIIHLPKILILSLQ